MRKIEKRVKGVDMTKKAEEKVTVRMDRELKQKFKKVIEERGLNQSYEIRQMIRMFIVKYEGKPIEPTLFK